MSGDDVESAFWLRPDWSGGDNLRDRGTTPFWTRPPLPLPPPALGQVITPGVGPQSLASMSNAALTSLARAYGFTAKELASMGRTTLIGEIMALTHRKR